MVSKPVTAILLIIVTLSFISGLAALIALRGLYTEHPVKASYPSGRFAYTDGVNFYIPVRFAPHERAPAVYLCRVGVIYQDPGGTVNQGMAIFYSGQTSSSFGSGTITFSDSAPTTMILQYPIETTMRILFNQPGYSLISILFYYCRYGDTNPEWSEELKVHLTPLRP